MPWLSRNGESIELGEGDTVVGAGTQAGWQVPNAGLAPRHFVVGVRRDAASVRPFGPDAIVTLNGRQLSAGEPSRLRDGDVVAAGRARFLFSVARPHGGMPAGDAEAQGQAYLINAATGAVHPLDQPSVGIGRDRSNSVVVSDATASRFHAEVRREAGGWVLHPMGSSGTKVNGRRTGTPCLLEDGDEIELAYTSLRFSRGAAPGGAPAPVGAPPTAEELDAARRPTIELVDDELAEAEAQALRTDEPGGEAPVGRRGMRWWQWALILALMLALVIWSTAA